MPDVMRVVTVVTVVGGVREEGAKMHEGSKWGKLRSGQIATATAAAVLLTSLDTPRQPKTPSLDDWSLSDDRSATDDGGLRASVASDAPQDQMNCLSGQISLAADTTPPVRTQIQERITMEGWSPPNTIS